VVHVTGIPSLETDVAPSGEHRPPGWTPLSVVVVVGGGGAGAVVGAGSCRAGVVVVGTEAVVVAASVAVVVDCAVPLLADATVVAGAATSVAPVPWSSSKSPPVAAAARTPTVRTTMAIGAARRAHCGQRR
jgi:hypothetical protein